MKSEANAQILKLSRKLKLLVLAIGGITIAVLIYGAWRVSFDFEAFGTDLGQYLLGNAAPLTLSTAAMAGLAILAGVNAAIVFGGLHAVWSLFSRYETGDLFSTQSSKLLRRAGLFALAGAVSSIVSRTLAILLVTLTAASGEKMLAVSLGSTELFLFLLAGLLTVLGHIMTVAAEIEADYRSFV